MPEHILIIGTVWPEPNSSAAGSRMLQLIEVFIEQSWKVTFASAAIESEYTSPLSRSVNKQRILLNDSSFDDWVGELSPTIVLFDRFMTEEQFGWRIALQCPTAIRILNTEDLHFLRRSRQLAIKESRPFSPQDLFTDTARREVASILRCDLTLLISVFEKEVLVRDFKIDSSILLHIPFMFQLLGTDVVNRFKTYVRRSGFVFIGNMLHEPNRDAVLFLRSEIWPAIRKCVPEAVIRIYGAYTPPAIENLHSVKDGFLILGRADDALEVISNAKVMLAPLRFGAGIKGKLVEAMQTGTPSVTTPVGAEGMREGSEWNGVVTADMQLFAKEAVELHNNEGRWKAAVQEGVELFNKQFLKSDHAPGLISRIVDVKGNIEQHRNINFIGSILMHHTLASTKYMSRWIEEKNKHLNL